MADIQSAPTERLPAAADMSVDLGLRRFMLGVYNKVALGLVLSAGLAYLTSMVPPVRDLMFQVTPDGRMAGYTAVGMIVVFAPLAIMMISMFAMRSPSAAGAGFLYWTISALIGASLGVLGLVYTGASLVSTFLITASAFGAMSWPSNRMLKPVARRAIAWPMRPQPRIPKVFP